jgi:hypothetical protein
MSPLHLAHVQHRQHRDVLVTGLATAETGSDRSPTRRSRVSPRPCHNGVAPDGEQRSAAWLSGVRADPCVAGEPRPRVLSALRPPSPLQRVGPFCDGALLSSRSSVRAVAGIGSPCSVGRADDTRSVAGQLDGAPGVVVGQGPPARVPGDRDRALDHVAI